MGELTSSRVPPTASQSSTAYQSDDAPEPPGSPMEITPESPPPAHRASDTHINTTETSHIDNPLVDSAEAPAPTGPKASVAEPEDNSPSTPGSPMELTTEFPSPTQRTPTPQRTIAGFSFASRDIPFEGATEVPVPVGPGSPMEISVSTEALSPTQSAPQEDITDYAPVAEYSPQAPPAPIAAQGSAAMGTQTEYPPAVEVSSMEASTQAPPATQAPFPASTVDALSAAQDSSTPVDPTCDLETAEETPVVDSTQATAAGQDPCADNLTEEPPTLIWPRAVNFFREILSMCDEDTYLTQGAPSFTLEFCRPVMQFTANSDRFEYDPELRLRAKHMSDDKFDEFVDVADELISARMLLCLQKLRLIEVIHYDPEDRVTVLRKNQYTLKYPRGVPKFGEDSECKVVELYTEISIEVEVPGKMKKGKSKKTEYFLRSIGEEVKIRRECTMVAIPIAARPAPKLPGLKRGAKIVLPKTELFGLANNILPIKETPLELPFIVHADFELTDSGHALMEEGRGSSMHPHNPNHSTNKYLVALISWRLSLLFSYLGISDTAFRFNWMSYLPKTKSFASFWDQGFSKQLFCFLQDHYLLWNRGERRFRVMNRMRRMLVDDKAEIVEGHPCESFFPSFNYTSANLDILQKWGLKFVTPHDLALKRPCKFLPEPQLLQDPPERPMIYYFPWPASLSAAGAEMGLEIPLASTRAMEIDFDSQPLTFYLPTFKEVIPIPAGLPLLTIHPLAFIIDDVLGDMLRSMEFKEPDPVDINRMIRLLTGKVHPDDPKRIPATVQESVDLVRFAYQCNPLGVPVSAQKDNEDKHYYVYLNNCEVGVLDVASPRVALVFPTKEPYDLYHLLESLAPKYIFKCPLSEDPKLSVAPLAKEYLQDPPPGNVLKVEGARDFSDWLRSIFRIYNEKLFISADVNGERFPSGAFMFMVKNSYDVIPGLLQYRWEEEGHAIMSSPTILNWVLKKCPHPDHQRGHTGGEFFKILNSWIRCDRIETVVQSFLKPEDELFFPWFVSEVADCEDCSLGHFYGIYEAEFAGYVQYRHCPPGRWWLPRTRSDLLIDILATLQTATFESRYAIFRLYKNLQTLIVGNNIKWELAVRITERIKRRIRALQRPLLFIPGSADRPPHWGTEEDGRSGRVVWVNNDRNEPPGTRISLQDAYKMVWKRFDEVQVRVFMAEIFSVRDWPRVEDTGRSVLAAVVISPPAPLTGTGTHTSAPPDSKALAHPAPPHPPPRITPSLVPPPSESRIPTASHVPAATPTEQSLVPPALEASSLTNPAIVAPPTSSLSTTGATTTIAKAPRLPSRAQSGQLGRPTTASLHTDGTAVPSSAGPSGVVYSIVLAGGRPPTSSTYSDPSAIPSPILRRSPKKRKAGSPGDGSGVRREAGARGPRIGGDDGVRNNGGVFVRDLFGARGGDPLVAPESQIPPVVVPSPAAPALSAPIHSPSALSAPLDTSTFQIPTVPSVSSAVPTTANLPPSSSSALDLVLAPRSPSQSELQSPEHPGPRRRLKMSHVLILTSRRSFLPTIQESPANASVQHADSSRAGTSGGFIEEGEASDDENGDEQEENGIEESDEDDKMGIDEDEGGDGEEEEEQEETATEDYFWQAVQTVDAVSPWRLRYNPHGEGSSRTRN